MTDSRTERRGGLWGLAFGALFAAAAATFLVAGDSGGTSQEVAAYYEEHAELEGIGYLLGAAGFCLLPFLGSLRTMLHRADGADGLATIAFGAGLVFTAMLLAVGATGSVVATTARWVDDYRVDPTVANTFETLTWFFWVYAGVAGGVLTGAASIVAWRTRVLPRWLAGIGLVAAVTGFATVATWGASTVVSILWIVLASLVMVVRSVRARERQAVVSASG